MLAIPAARRWRQEEQKVNVLMRCTGSWGQPELKALKKKKILVKTKQRVGVTSKGLNGS